MHGSIYANYAVDNADLVLALGVRFDDRVTGKVSEFASRAKIIHVDIDPSEIGKIKRPDLAIVSDLKYFLRELNKVVEPPAGGRMATQGGRLETRRAVPLRSGLRRHPAATRHPRAVPADEGPRRDHRHGRGPAPDVGRAILQVPPAAALAFQRRAGHDGLRPAGRRRAPRPPIPIDSWSTSTATAAS